MHELFRHEAMPYDGRPSFVPTTVSIVRDGLERDERVIILAVAEKIDGLREELGDESEDVTFVPTDEHGRNPCRITTMLHSFQSAGDGRHSLAVNESVVVGRPPAAQVEARYADSVLNDSSLRTWPLSVVCLFDTATLDRANLESMYEGHPVVRGLDHNPGYRPELAATMYATPLDPAPAEAVRMSVTGTGLTGTRNFVRENCSAFGIGADRTDDLVLAANEVVTNSLRYGGGRAALTMWTQTGAAVCDVADRGHLRDPLAGRIAPPAAATRGRGLWLANHLCDLVQVRSSPGRTMVRMFIEQ